MSSTTATNTLTNTSTDTSTDTSTSTSTSMPAHSSDGFSLITLHRLLHMILEEEKTGSILGIHKDLFFTPSATHPFRMERYGQTLETPVGVAAGPHTQMAQNIICAWLTGARYMELKTIQTLDQLEISKPCIDMEDEGYNCEWSQELRIKESFSEYLNAWIIIHILRHKWGWDKLTDNSANQNKGPGFIFNMSVGYNMEGILKENVQWFLAKMNDCRPELEEKILQIRDLYPEIGRINIPHRLSDNITLSTMHGCPPDEIEKIAAYLIKEKKLHTTVKLNPTLLGPQTLRGILNDKLGFETHVPDEAFNHDLKYPDALKLIKNLEIDAAAVGVRFGLKLTNTLESVNHRSVFPENEKMMYMSGRALHPLSVNLARKVRADFPHMDISFSAGADCFNLPHIIACDLKPVTVCSDLLKPGGYGRLSQYLDILGHRMASLKAADIPQYITATAKQSAEGEPEKDLTTAADRNLATYAEAVLSHKEYQKAFLSDKSIKTSRPLEAFDCIQAPCVTTCPTNQDIPEYIHAVASGDPQRALAQILLKNPFPSVTGKVCDHPCMTKCTRRNYDTPIHIRDLKGFAAHHADREPQLRPAAPNGLKTAVIGAGPSGLSCAYFLALAGFAVTVYETKAFAGGMVSDAIPMFRLSHDDIAKDIQRIESLGVNIRYDSAIDAAFFKKLEKENDYVYIAVGAQKSTRMNIKGEDLPNVIDALTFLSRIRRGRSVDLGTAVAVIGGGNSAMDAARAAKRLVKGDNARVVVLYRRTRHQMPAADEEIEEALAEGINVVELTTPAEIRSVDGRLQVICWKMELGEKDDSGRRRPMKIEGADFNLTFDSVIPAIGQTVDLAFLQDRKWFPVDISGETAIPRIYMGGDALRGPLNIITAIADGKRAAVSIIQAAGRLDDVADLVYDATAVISGNGSDKCSLGQYQFKAARRVYGVSYGVSTHGPSKEILQAEAHRCLMCGDVCNVCVTVCPNRANAAYSTPLAEYVIREVCERDGALTLTELEPFVIQQEHQTYNIADFCNHCGNCQTFCPTSGAPYKDKPRICLTPESFAREADAYHITDTDEGRQIQSKRNGRTETLTRTAEEYIYHTPDAAVHLEPETFNITKVTFKHPAATRVDTLHAVRMKILLDSITVV